MLEAPYRYGSLHVIWDHTELPATRQRQRLPPLPWYLIYPPVKDERLSRPEITQVNDLPRVTKKVSAVPGVSCMVKPAFCSAKYSRCEQLAHSCYAVTGFSGTRIRVVQTHVECANHSAITAPTVSDEAMRQSLAPTVSSLRHSL